jgi:hypothetical protein
MVNELPASGKTGLVSERYTAVGHSHIICHRQPMQQMAAPFGSGTVIGAIREIQKPIRACKVLILILLANFNR